MGIHHTWERQSLYWDGAQGDVRYGWQNTGEFANLRNSLILSSSIWMKLSNLSANWPACAWSFRSPWIEVYKFPDAISQANTIHVISRCTAVRYPILDVSIMTPRPQMAVPKPGSNVSTCWMLMLRVTADFGRLTASQATIDGHPIKIP